MRAPRYLGSLLFLVLAASCSSSGRQAPRANQGAPAAPARHSVAHLDPATGRPTFVWLARDDRASYHDAPAAARATLAHLTETLELSGAARDAVGAPQIHDPGAGPIVARHEQHVRDIEVWSAGLDVVMTREFEPIAASTHLAPTLAGSERPFVLDASDALRRAAADLGDATTRFVGLDRRGAYQRFSAPHLAQPARVKRVFVPAGRVLAPAYYVELMHARGGAWAFLVAADDGGVLLRHDLVRHDQFTYRAYASATSLLPMDGPQGNDAAPHPTGAPNGWRPTWGPSQLVTLQNFPFSRNDPWLPPGATVTTGNNIDAYADRAQGDGFGAGDERPSTTSASTFDYTYDTAQPPGASTASIRAAATQLFYVTNFMHDWMYDAGFDEKARNPQTDNFGRGGAGGDPILAEAQDFSGRNNANAATPADGASPRIQMFVFSGPTSAQLTVTAPAGIAGDKPTNIASFGKDTFDTTGAVVLASDGSGTDDADACEPLAAPATGKIVLAHRGLCSFVQKAQNAQNAGAIGLIVANVSASAQPTTPPYMGGTSATITIPVLSLALADGQAVEAASGASVRLKRDVQVDLDGALDTSVVVHEWGHVLSNRLIGNGTGLLTNQAGGLGEGWSDFVALMLMARADDTLTAQGAGWAGAYPNGAYAMSGAGSDFYYGIRRVPYSTDMTKDPLTFKHIQNGVPLTGGAPIAFGEDGSFNAEVHSTGEVWATMLWECYAGLLRDARYTFAQAQDKMKRYLVAAMKLTPRDPTLLEARDALLAAAYATDEKDYLVLWTAFGKRGAGVGATGPAKDSANNATVKESFVVGNELEIVKATFADDVLTCDHDGFLDEGEVGTLELIVKNVGTGTLSATTGKLSSKTTGVTFSDGDVVRFATMKPFASAKVTTRVSLRGEAQTAPLALQIGVTDPTLAVARTVEVVVPTRYNTDEAPESSTVDRVDTRATAWTVAGQDTSGTTRRWSRTGDATNRWWTVPNAAEPSQHALVSPPFTLTGNKLTVTFKHRWSFRYSTRRQVDVDGGVVEVSTDGGKTWKDASAFGTIDYNTTLDTGGRGDNVLKGRRAYGNKSAGYPDKWIDSRVELTFPQQPESVVVRFFVGTGTNFSGAPGWDLNDVELFGTASKPFLGFVPHADQCDPAGPTASAGPAKTARPFDTVKLEGSATHPKDAPLTFVWAQVAGPPVRLRDESGPTPAFEAPGASTPTTLTFSLRAHDGRLLSAASRVDVRVEPAPAVPPQQLDAGGCGCRQAGHGGRASAAAFAAIAAALLRRRRRAIP